MTFYQWKQGYTNKIFRENSFKNTFVRLWEMYGNIDYIDGKKYLKDYKISGNKDGAVKMSRCFKNPSLHNDISNEDGVDNAYLIFDFTKLLVLTDGMLSSWIFQYQQTMLDKDFDKLYYRIWESQVVEAYFVSVEEGSDGKPFSEEPINDAFLNQLAFDIAEQTRLSYYDGFSINFGGLITEIIFDEEISSFDLSQEMNSLIDKDFLPFFVDDVFKPVRNDIQDRVFIYAIENNIQTDILDDYPFLDYIEDRGLSLSISSIKEMKASNFLKLVEKSLDFDIDWKSSYVFKRIFTGLLAFTLSAILVYTGNIASGFALLSGYLGSTTGNKYLKLASSLLAIYSLGVEDGVFSLVNIGYVEAVELILQISNLYYSLETGTVKKEDEAIDSSTSYTLLYESPFNAYSDIYEYEDLTSISTVWDE